MLIVNERREKTNNNKRIILLELNMEQNKVFSILGINLGNICINMNIFVIT